MPSVQHQYVTIYAGDGLLSMAVLTVITAVRSITVPGSAAVPLATLIAEPEAQATSSPGGRANSGKALTRPPAACKRIEALLRGRGYLRISERFKSYSQLWYKPRETQAPSQSPELLLSNSKGRVSVS